MPRQAIENTNVGLYSPLSIMIDPTAPHYLAYNAQFTYPAQSAPYNIADYAQAAGQFLFQIQIRTENAAKGSVAITYPWSESNSVTTDYIGGARQSYSYTYSYITIFATPTYPRTFNSWLIDQTSGTLSTSRTVDVAFNSSVITSNQTLTAIFN
jgi:hypothetical protein